MKPVSIALVGADVDLLNNVRLQVGVHLPCPEVSFPSTLHSNVFAKADLPELDILTAALLNAGREESARYDRCSFVTTETPFSALARIGLVHEEYGKLPQILPNMLRLTRTTLAIQTITMLSTLNTYSAVYALPVADDAPEFKRLLDKQMRLVLETLNITYAVLYGSAMEIADKIVSQVEEASATMENDDATSLSDTDGSGTLHAGEVAAVPQAEGEVPNLQGNGPVPVSG